MFSISLKVFDFFLNTFSFIKLQCGGMILNIYSPQFLIISPITIQLTKILTNISY